MITIVHSIYSQSVHALALNAGQWTTALIGTVGEALYDTLCTCSVQ